MKVKCSICSQFTKHPLQCSNCKNALYCCKECQEEDWYNSNHQQLCASMSTSQINDPLGDDFQQYLTLLEESRKTLRSILATSKAIAKENQGIQLDQNKVEIFLGLFD